MVTVTITDEQWAIAGRSARAWSIRLRPKLKRCTTREYHELWDEILDGSLADAGILPDRTPAYVPPRCAVCLDHPDANCEFCPAV